MNKSELNVNGVILREIDIGEGDKLITLLTSEMGRITVSCRGVRSLKSRRFSAVQLFSYDEMTLVESNGRYSLKEASVTESFFGLRESIEAISLASYFADVAATVTVEGQDENEMLRLLLNSFYLLAKREKEPELVKSVFELRASCAMGFMPDLSGCSVCGVNNTAKAYYLDLNNGVLKCGDCIFGAEGADGEQSGLILPLAYGVLAAMRYICDAPPKRAFSFTVDAALLPELSTACEKYLQSHVERGFDTLNYYKSIRE